MRVKDIISNSWDRLKSCEHPSDDCWQSELRDSASGRVLPDPNKFPSGFKALTDRIHSLGLRVGIYSSAGTKTCAGYPGSLYNEVADAQAWADDGFDALKYDNCFEQGLKGSQKISNDRFARMSKAIMATGRPTILALCNWGQDQPWEWAPSTWNSCVKEKFSPMTR